MPLVVLSAKAFNTTHAKWTLSDKVCKNTWLLKGKIVTVARYASRVFLCVFFVSRYLHEYVNTLSSNYRLIQMLKTLARLSVHAMRNTWIRIVSYFVSKCISDLSKAYQGIFCQFSFNKRLRTIFTLYIDNYMIYMFRRAWRVIISNRGRVPWLKVSNNRVWLMLWTHWCLHCFLRWSEWTVWTNNLTLDYWSDLVTLRVIVLKFGCPCARDKGQPNKSPDNQKYWCSCPTDNN